MGRLERAVRRSRAHLHADESLLASTPATGVEGPPGRQVVLLSGQRILVCASRCGTPQVELPVDVSTRSCFDARDGTLTLTRDDERVVLAGVEEAAAGQIAQLLEVRRHLAAQPSGEVVLRRPSLRPAHRNSG